MVTCPNPSCNFSGLADDSVFCTECGTPIAPAAPEPQVQVAPPEPEPQVQVAPPEPEPQVQVAPPEPTPPPPQSAETRLVLPDNTTITIGTGAKVFGRSEMLNYLGTLQGVDPMIVSRQHFTVYEENNQYFIEDGDTIVQDKPSTNHTYLNGEDITGKGKKALADGAIIDLSNTMKLTFKSQ